MCVSSMHINIKLTNDSVEIAAILVLPMSKNFRLTKNNVLIKFISLLFKFNEINPPEYLVSK